MSELNLEEIRRKAQNAVTATDKEWAKIAYFLLNRIENLEDNIFDLEQENALNLEALDRLSKELEDAEDELRELRPLVAGDFWIGP